MENVQDNVIIVILLVVLALVLDLLHALLVQEVCFYQIQNVLVFAKTALMHLPIHKLHVIIHVHLVILLALLVMEEIVIIV